MIVDITSTRRETRIHRAASIDGVQLTAPYSIVQMNRYNAYDRN